ncbi:MAG: polyribonucleotide nucleotidyltransferase [Fusobacteriaceae bacterium]
MFNESKMSIELGGRTLTVASGKVARQSNGAVMSQYGDTVILTTVNRSKAPKAGLDFFPLTVEYVEKFYAAGKFPGGFNKRESRPGNDAILTSRLIDRPIRPMFPEGFRYDTQIVNTAMSFDGKNSANHVGITMSSLALMISDLPFSVPVAGVVVGYINGEFIVNPTPEQLEISELDLVVAGSEDAINMVEAGASELSEEIVLKAMMFAHEHIKKLCAFQKEFTKLVGKEKMEFTSPVPLALVKEFIDATCTEELKLAVVTEGKHSRDDAMDSLEEKSFETFKEINFPGEEEVPSDIVKEFKNYFHDLMKKVVRDAILYKKHRADGRKTTEIRALNAEVGVLPIPHGSAMFTRGETQAIVVATLGTKSDEQLVDSLEKDYYKKFYLHYNFPPYSVGETGRMGAPGRRELGHGALAERALSYVLPSQEDFPYTIRLVSEITESNGSSSQASVCGGSLALMNAGVPIKEHVAGIAMGLIKEGNDYVVLTDIQGLEDHLGDMDFKVAGTKKGITALQMDMKITGINEAVLKEAMAQALNARLEILEVMNEAVSTKQEMKPTVPRIHQMTIAKDKISVLIGPGGKNIRGIIETTGATVDIDDTGKVSIFAVGLEVLEKTIQLVNGYVKDVEIGEVYKGKVVNIQKFGAFMEIMPGKEGLLHISEISEERVANVEDVLKVGDVFEVKVKSVEGGKVSLTKKGL